MLSNSSRRLATLVALLVLATSIPGQLRDDDSYQRPD